MAKLDERQRHFCREVAKGRSARLAYIAAFDCKESAASACASRLMKRANIREEISRLRKLAAEVRQERVDAAREDGRDVRALWAKADRQERLQEWAQLAVEAGRIDTAIRCVDLLNKMDGAYVVEAGPSQEDEQDMVLRREILERAGGFRIGGSE